MPYMIDGHNLIPKLPGVNLAALDDETQLIERLQEFCRLSRKRVEVYFDNAPPGQPRARSFGLVIAHFVREGNTADEAIRARLSRLGHAARNWTVVSSDLEVQASARSARAKPLPSEKFAQLMYKTLEDSSQETHKQPDTSLGPDELDDWLELFGSRDSDK